jgi:hypothetical protein
VPLCFTNGPGGGPQAPFVRWRFFGRGPRSRQFDVLFHPRVEPLVFHCHICGLHVRLRPRAVHTAQAHHQGVAAPEGAGAPGVHCDLVQLVFWFPGGTLVQSLGREVWPRGRVFNVRNVHGSCGGFWNVCSPRDQLERMKNYTQNEWRRLKTTLETGGKD